MMRFEVGPEPASLLGRLKHYSEQTPNNLAIVSNGFECNYLQLAKLVSAQAHFLRSKNINASSVVGIRCEDNLCHFILTAAASALGATVFTVPTFESENIRKNLIDRCEASHVLDSSDLIQFNEKIAKEGVLLVSKDTPNSSFLFATSGTSGKPKLVLHYDVDIVAQAHRHVNSSKERFACLAAMEHNFAKRHRLYCLAQGATNVFIDEAEDLVDQCIKLNVNVLHLSGFQAQQLVAHPHSNRLKHVRVKLGGSHVSTNLRKQIKHNVTSQLQAGYGTTETGAIAFTEPDEEVDLETVGKPLPGIELRIANPDGRILSAGHRGEILIRSPGMFRGYQNQPELTETRLKDGWFYTGDIGYIDEKGRIYLAGRVDDMFVFNSINIYPQDIETCLLKMPEVADVSVIPKASGVHGDIPVAFVVLTKNKPADIRALKKKAQDALGLRSPRQFIVVDELPRNTSGKIDRRFVQKLSYQPAQIKSAILDTLASYDVDRNVNKNALKKFEHGEGDISLEDLNLESIAVVALLVLFEIEFDTIITPQTFVGLATLNRIVTYVLDNTGNATDAEELGNNRVYEDLKDKPPLLRFFQRILSCTHSTATLNKALDTLEHRLTPAEFRQLHIWFRSNQLVPQSSSDSHFVAVRRWFSYLFTMMPDSEKSSEAKFIANRISPAIWHYGTGENSENKTLIICFATMGTRRLVLPNPVLLQYVNDRYYDVMVIGEPLAQSYEHGVPFLGKREQNVVNAISGMSLLKKYRKIQTVGCSAGAHMAIALAYKIGASQCLAIGGRFHKERYPHKIIRRLFVLHQAIKRKSGTQITLCYSDRVSRDRIFAKLIAKIARGTRFAIKIEGGKFSHQVVNQVSEMGKLKEFLSAALFEEAERLREIGDKEMIFPSGEINTLTD